MARSWGPPLPKIDREAEAARQEAELDEHLAEQRLRLEVLRQAEEAKILQETKAAEAEVAETAYREKVARAREERIIRFKDSCRYTAQLGTEICRRIANGEVLKAICSDATMPHMHSVLDWLDDTGGQALGPQLFRESYLKACRKRNLVFEDDLIIIADDSSNDYVDKLNLKTNETYRTLDPEALTRAKLRIDIRLKILKANDPGRWGDGANTQASLRQLEADRRPAVVINFHKAFPRGDGSDARQVMTIEHNKRVITVNPDTQEVA